LQHVKDAGLRVSGASSQKGLLLWATVKGSFQSLFPLPLVVNA